MLPPTIPVFPLPNVVLFPNVFLPLHIFEPRYRQMIEDLLDGPGQIVMGTVVEEHADALAGSPRIRMYRRVEIEPLLETAPTKEREALLRTLLRRAILARCDEATNLPNEIPISCLVDLLLQRLGLPQREMEGLYEELDVETRAEGALAIHAQHPHTRRGRRGKASE
jgi:Lon protease-like protein